MKFNYSSDAVLNHLFYMTSKHDANILVLLYIIRNRMWKITYNYA